MPDEVIRAAFPSKPYPRVSYNLPFHEACAKHFDDEDINASRLYFLVSGTLSRETDAFGKLESAAGRKVVGVRKGMKSHTLWSEVIEITNEIKRTQADTVVTLGGGSLTDAAKVAVLVGLGFPAVSFRVKQY
jgi:alcohol dehydrogenase class IV